MKIYVIIVAGAQACGNHGHVETYHMETTCGNHGYVERTCGTQQCDFGEWLANNWWASAVETFNCASKNWEEFTHFVKSVSRTDHFLKEYTQCTVKLRSLKLRFYLVVHLSCAFFEKL